MYDASKEARKARMAIPGFGSDSDDDDDGSSSSSSDNEQLAGPSTRPLSHQLISSDEEEDDDADDSSSVDSDGGGGGGDLEARSRAIEAAKLEEAAEAQEELKRTYREQTAKQVGATW